jgi:hypothetical protein
VLNLCRRRASVWWTLLRSKQALQLVDESCVRKHLVVSCQATQWRCFSSRSSNWRGLLQQIQKATPRRRRRRFRCDLLRKGASRCFALRFATAADSACLFLEAAEEEAVALGARRSTTRSVCAALRRAQWGMDLWQLPLRSA